MSSSPEAVAVLRPMATPQLVTGTQAGRAGEPAPPSTGFAGGFAAGFAEGLRQASQRAVADERARAQRESIADATRTAASERAVAGLVHAAVRLAELPDGIVESLADSLAREVVDLAEAVLTSELAEPGRRAATAMRRALSGAADQIGVAGRVTVRLHPDDVAALDTGAAGGIDLIADSTLRPGDATAVAGARWIDARLHQTLTRVREAIADAAAAPGSDGTPDPGPGGVLG